ncbi:hypothetical protein VTK26DRAFT_801 [Humicola hyalothermophila]
MYQLLGVEFCLVSLGGKDGGSEGVQVVVLGGSKADLSVSFRHVTLGGMRMVAWLTEGRNWRWCWRWGGCCARDINSRMTKGTSNTYGKRHTVYSLLVLGIIVYVVGYVCGQFYQKTQPTTLGLCSKSIRDQSRRTISHHTPNTPNNCPGYHSCRVTSRPWVVTNQQCWIPLVAQPQRTIHTPTHPRLEPSVPTTSATPMIQPASKYASSIIHPRFTHTIDDHDPNRYATV